MTTSYIDPAAELRQLANGPLGDLVAVLVFQRGITVRGGHIDPAQCEWCGDEGALTTVRIYGQPDDTTLHPVELAEVCGVCAPAVIDRALSEKRGWVGDIVVEVAA